MLSYKEFYIWLDGFMSNRSWTIIRESDIETIQQKMKEVKDVDSFFSDSRRVTPPTFKPAPIPINPFKEDGFDELGTPPKIVM